MPITLTLFDSFSLLLLLLCSISLSLLLSSSLGAPSSSKECNVLSGIDSEPSAKPISSKLTTETDLDKSSFFWKSAASLNAFTIISDVVNGEHWKLTKYVSFKFWYNSDRELRPIMARDTIDLASDFELPGLPTMNSGMRSSMQIIIMNTFSSRAELRAIFVIWFRSMSSINMFWHLSISVRIQSPLMFKFIFCCCIELIKRLR